jgi:methylglutaconyl-CoA hydratase
MSKNEKEGGVEVSIDGGVARVTFHHPKSNSLPGSVLSELAETIEEQGEDPQVSVIVLQSKGEKAFCAGASFDELVSIKNEDQGKEFFMGFARVIVAAKNCPKFIIGRVQGKAVGGGVGMAAATDYCLATEGANIKLSELALGIGPFVVGPAVERKIGRGNFAAMSIDTEWRDATWAREKGLYTELYSSIEELDQAVDALAEKLAGFNPEAMHELKLIFWQGTEDWDYLLEERAEQSGRLVLSDYTKKAIEQAKAASKK